MPNIRSNTDLTNNNKEMSVGRHELYQLLESGRVAIKKNSKRPLINVLADVRQDLNDGKFIQLV